MRKAFKKVISVLLSVVIVFGSVPFASFIGLELPNVFDIFGDKAKALEVSDLPEDFDWKKYNVEKLFGFNDNNGIWYDTFLFDMKIAGSEVVYEAFLEDSGFVDSIVSYETTRAMANPSNVLKHMNLQQKYETLIYTVLFSTLKSKKFVEFETSNYLSESVKLTDTIVNDSQKAYLLSVTDLTPDDKQSLKDTAMAFVTNKNGIENKWAALGEYTELVKKYSDILDVVLKSATSVANIVNAASMCYTLMDSGATVVEYLENLREYYDDPVYRLAVTAVIDAISTGWGGIVEKIIVDTGNAVMGKAIEDYCGYLLSYCYDFCPLLKMITIGERVGSAVNNLLFATDDLVDQVVTLKIINLIEKAATGVLESCGDKCKLFVTSSNADILMFAFDFSYSAFCVGTETGVEVMNIANNKGVVNWVRNLFPNERELTFNEFEESTKGILTNVENAYYFVKNCWQYFIEYDYPEFFEKLNSNGMKAEPIKSISAYNDEITVRVGDLVCFNYSVNPDNHIGDVGLKSDNESVVKSSEPIDFLYIANEENIGTANVTIYSVDNPSINTKINVKVVAAEEEIPDGEGKIVSETNVNGYTFSWELNKSSGRLTIKGSGGMPYWSSESDIPWAKYKSYIRSIIIENGITSISENAFKGCPNVDKIILNNTITYISDYAFYGCSKLTDINLPDGLFQIGEYAFGNLPLVKEIVVPDSVVYICEGAFYGCNGLEKITLPFIGYSIESGSDLSAVFGYIFGQSNSYSESVTSQSYMNSYSAYYYIPQSLRSVTITQEDYISCGAFDNCWFLTEINIPDEVKHIDNYAFRNCSGITEAEIPATVTGIGEEAFYGCSKLTDINLPDGLFQIGEYAFGNLPLVKEIVVPDSVVYICEGAFYGCNGLEKITLPFIGYSIESGSDLSAVFGYIFGQSNSYSESVTSQSYMNSYSAYYYIPQSLRSVTITQEDYISYGAFENCWFLTEINIPDDVEYIYDYAFYSCSRLSHLHIPPTVEYIGNNALYDSAPYICSDIQDCYVKEYADANSIEFRLCNGHDTGTSDKYWARFWLDDDMTQLYYEVELPSGSEITYPDAPEIPGKEFIGWDNELSSMPVGGANFVAMFIDNEYFIEFFDKDDNVIDDYILYWGDEITEDDLPLVENIEGYDFDGWYNEEGEKYDFPVTVESDLSFFAEYRVQGYKIMYYVDGAEYDYDAYVFGEEIELRDNLVKEGYTFSGWKDSDGNDVVLPNTMPAHDIYVYGTWTANEPEQIGGTCGENLTWTFDEATGELVISGTGEMYDWDSSNIPWYGYRSSIKTVTITDGVTSIGKMAFYNCTNLISITSPNSITSIGNHAFSDCDSLTCAPIPTGVTSIGRGAFTNCGSLTNIIIPDSVANIDEFVFSECISLTSITIPAGVTIIGDFAFYHCSNLTNIYYKGDIAGWCVIEFANAWSNPMYYSDNIYINGILLEGDIVIPNDVTNIGFSAFRDCTGLTSITIPDSVASIGDYAFYDCENLKYVHISTGTINIGSNVMNRNSYICSTTDDCYAKEYADTNGIEFRICDGHILTEPDHMHSFVSKITTSATCITDGTMTYICECGDSYTEVIPATGHSSFKIIYELPSTCVSKGIRTVKCGNCDYTHDNYLAIVPHECGEWEVVTESTCTTVGEKVKKCTVCGETLETIEIAVAEHIAGEWEITTNATCTENGEKIKKCVDCGTILETEAITATGHSSFKIIYELPSTCISKGIRTVQCGNCDYTHDNYLAIVSHTPGAWETVLEPTTETEGKKVKKCTVCGVTLEEAAIAKLPKEPVKDNTVLISPSTSSISYGDSIILHVDASKIPEGGYVEWIASNNNFNWSANGETCTISPEKSGDTTFTATIYDAENNPVSTDEQTMTSKAGFFDKIIAFFKKLFGATKVIPQAFKGVF